MWFLEGAAVRYTKYRIKNLSECFKYAEGILMLMKNYDNWKTTKRVSSRAKNLSVLSCFDITHFDLAT